MSKPTLGHIRALRDETVARAIADFVADSVPACGHGRPRGGRGCEDCALEEEHRLGSNPSTSTNAQAVDGFRAAPTDTADD